MIYLTSDLHLCHNKPFCFGPRGFSNVYEMNRSIVMNWHHIVQPEDEVYILGDMMLCDDVVGTALVKQLTGKIHLILGNHDTDQRAEIFKNCWNICEVTHATRLKYKGYHFFLSHYPCLTSNFDYDKPLKARLISLCGHTHTKDKFADWHLGPIYHVELDAHHCKPISLDQIIEDIEAKVREN